MSNVEHLEDLIAQLERAAEQLLADLRSVGELSPDGAATMVEDCAALATRAAAELEQLALDLRSVEANAVAPGQDSLL
jgi:hypothetical protein